jgi:hypothetical protein
MTLAKMKTTRKPRLASSCQTCGDRGRSCFWPFSVEEWADARGYLDHPDCFIYEIRTGAGIIELSL